MTDASRKPTRPVSVPDDRAVDPTRQPLSLAEVTVLRALVNHSPTSPVGLQENTGMSRSWVYRVVQRLVKRRYVEKTRSRLDPRRVTLVPTEQGREAIDATRRRR